MLILIKRLFNIILLFLTVVLYSQTKIRITYDVGMRAHKTDSSLTKEQNRYNDFVKNVAKRTYILDIQNNQSLFYMINKMKKDIDKKIDLVSVFVGDGIYYYNTETNKTLNKVNELGEDFIIESQVKYKWKLTQESKRIGKRNCFKATTNQKFIDRMGETKTKKIIAWYDPVISLNIGLRDYHGLPGAIIFLEDGNIYYECIKIELNLKENFNIEKPTKGRVITEVEFDNMIKNDFSKKFEILNKN